MITAREYVSNKYPELPIYLLGFSLGSFIVRTNADLSPYKKRNPDWYGKSVCYSDEIYDLLFGTYEKNSKANRKSTGC